MAAAAFAPSDADNDVVTELVATAKPKLYAELAAVLADDDAYRSRTAAAAFRRLCCHDADGDNFFLGSPAMENSPPPALSTLRLLPCPLRDER